MSEKIICEKCGNEMVSYIRGSCCGMECKNCGWGWATTYIEPIRADQCIYSIILQGQITTNADFIRVVSKIKVCNFLQARAFLAQGGELLRARAPEVQKACRRLESAGLPYTVSPDFPYEIDEEGCK